jgi:hypothetical protein
MDSQYSHFAVVVIDCLFSDFAGYELIHMDEFIEELLREERAFDVILPRIQVPSGN